MERTIDIGRYYDGNESPLFLHSEINFVPGITMLVGCNGSGKTFMLQRIAQELEKSGIPVLSLAELEVCEHLKGEFSLRGDEESLSALVNMMSSSEGEKIMFATGHSVSQIGKFVRSVEGTEAWILLDSCDSGVSIDGISELKSAFDFIISDTAAKGISLYIVASANAYEMVREMNCLDVTESEYISFQTYDDYRDFIMKSSEKKDDRYSRDAALRDKRL